MPRVNHAAAAVVAKAYPTLPLTALSADLAFFASDATNKEMVDQADNLILVAWNSGASPRTITITSAPYLGRSGDITTYAVGVGLHSIFGPFPAAGWRQADGKLYFEASHLDVKWALILT